MAWGTEGSRLETGSAEGTLKGRFFGGFGAVVGEGFEDGLRAAGLLGKKDGQGFFEAFEAEVGLAGVPFDAIEEGGEVDQFAARVHEVEVEEFLLARHGGMIRGDRTIPSGKDCQQWGRYG